MNSILTVTLAATDLALLTAAELRAAAGLQDSDTSEDVALTRLGARVAAAIARECGVAAGGTAVPTLRQETLSEVFRNVSCVPELILSRRPIVSVSAVTVDGTALTASDYEIDAPAGLMGRLSSDYKMDWYAEKVTVAYIAGWAVVPPDLKLAAAKLAAFFYSTEGRDPLLKAEEEPDVYRAEYWVGDVTKGAGIPADVKALLKPYYG